MEKTRRESSSYANPLKLQVVLSINKTTYLSWFKFFDEGEGRNSQFQVEALLAYSLLYCVFPSSPEDGLHNYVFPSHVLLAKGSRLALVPLYLGSLYARLEECSRSIFKSFGQYDVVSCSYGRALPLPRVHAAKPEKIIVN